MTDAGRLYLMLILVSALGLCGCLFWAMIATSRESARRRRIVEEAGRPHEGGPSGVLRY